MNEIKILFEREHLEILGLTDAAPLPEEEEQFNDWIRAGYNGTMDYLRRHAGKKYRPGELLPGCNSIIFTGLSYFQPREEVPPGHGTVARYAWGRDYHKVLGKRLKRIAKNLREMFPGERFFPFVDTTPLAERPFAARAGVGFIGRNTLLIRRGLGSWFVIGGIATTLEADVSGLGLMRGAGAVGHDNPDAGARREASGDGGRRRVESEYDGRGACPPGCSRCIDACPTGALSVPYKIDARKCISYLTIEHKGVIETGHALSIGGRIFGCDACQEACPFNSGIETTYVADFLSGRVGQSLSIADVLSIENAAEFQSRFAGTAVMRSGRTGLLRNASICAVNLGLSRLLPALEGLTGDRDEVIAKQAAWAVEMLR